MQKNLFQYLKITYWKMFIDIGQLISRYLIHMSNMIHYLNGEFKFKFV